MLGLGKSTGYQFVSTGNLPIVRVGRAIRIPMQKLKAWIETRTEMTNPI